MAGPADNQPIVSAWRLDGKGGGQELEQQQIAKWDRGDGVLWLHINRGATGAAEVLTGLGGLPDPVIEALLAQESRPRLLLQETGLLVNLRGVNLNPGAAAEDMVGLRVWLEADRIVTLRLRKVFSIDDIRAALSARNGPKGAADLLIVLSGRLVERMTPVVAGLTEEIDEIEDEIVDQIAPEFGKRLSELRRRVVRLHRFMAPQRDVLGALPQVKQPWISTRQQASFREIADRSIRLVEELEAVRERAAVTYDEMYAQQTDRMARNTYVLSIVAAVALPLTLISGLLGMNVGGIPLSEQPWGFAIVTAALAAAAIVGVWILRRIGWL